MPSDPAPGEVVATLTLSVLHTPSGGPLVSLKSDGLWSGDSVNHRYYSFGEMSPAELPPHIVWGHLLGIMGGMLTSDT